MGAMYVLACADKFRGTLTAPEFGAAVAAGAEGHEVVSQPLADGGEGTLDAFGGPNRRDGRWTTRRSDRCCVAVVGWTRR